ncbi:MAG: NmrA family NAD(P)-binding protein [Hyphomonas sp.]|nr:NmrA family NAD(P)-binding protein [Hyphomonas sp.]
MFVVLGASGRAGGETARALMQAGERVRVVLRRPEQAGIWATQGADVAIANIEDVGSLAAALRGTTGAFLLSPPPVDGDPDARAEVIGRSLAQAVRQSGVQRAVVLSSMHLHSAAPSVTFLRPGYFVETWGEVALAVFADGVLPSFLDPAQKIPMVSTVDVGRTAADLLRRDTKGTRVMELRGPQDWSADDVATAFGQVLGRSVETLFIPPEARLEILVQEGVPPQIAAALLGMYDGIASGRVEHEESREVRRGSFSLVDAVTRIVRDADVGGTFVSAYVPG